MKKDETSQSIPEPAAYDTEGRPLYYHPPKQYEPEVPSLVNTKPEAIEGNNFNPKIRAQYANEPDFTHASRPLEPVVPEISDKLRSKCEDSRRRYPFLNLSEGEFVILRIRRHPIGLFIPVSITAVVVVLLASVMLLYPDFYAYSDGLLPPVGTAVVALLLMMVFAGVIGGVAVWVYLQNQFFLTNESVIQEIQHGLFSRHEQTVSLGSIEDASFKQYGIFPHLFDYGLMRLSTEGEETTYRFNYVENPKQQVAIVNNAVEAFKNGRPVGAEYLDS